MRKSIASCLFLIAALPLAAQTTPAPSPAAAPKPVPATAFRTPRVSTHQTLMQTIGLTDVTIDYSRPAVKKRAIWGALVPYGKVWRTGANEATRITFSDDVTINGQPLPKGSYSLHTIPGPDTWIIIFNKVAQQWGSFTYDQAQDALRVTVTPTKAGFSELLTFTFPEVSTDNGHVEIRWENLAVPFTIGTNTTEKVTAAATAAVAAATPTDAQTPYRAAQFAFDVNDNYNAARWLEQSIKAKATPSNLYLRARLEARQGDRAAAIKDAKAALALVDMKKDADFAEEIQNDVNAWTNGK